ncbi:MAG: hypothetical protein K2M78_06870 [Lachnospiraceae bacterium]|nr:hypothetical protein [Lachnospiraceae bacterium]
MENVSYHVAAVHINEELLTDILDNILNGTYEVNEELKLKVLNAISIEDNFY